MCGIFGIVFRQTLNVPAEERLASSARLLHHRGPDAQATYSAPGIGLAHTRLSFLDIDARSNQPFWDDQHRYCLIYNGEIYNYKEIREELRERGVKFHTTGDTEVLLQALIHDDPEYVLPRLRGMFGFALYDAEQRSMLLARDRFGMKPLYVYEDDGTFMFASEIKAMRAWVSLELDHFSICSYLLKFGGPTKGFTFHRRLKSVPPGSIVRYQENGPVEYSTFFTLPDFWDRETMESLAGFSPTKMIDTMDEMLFKSIQDHMFADVPVGAFCSGGVDSSLLTAMAARSYTNLAIFHANVKGQWSEHHAAAALSRHLRLDLRSIDVEEQDFVDQLPLVMYHYEHPFTYHPNCAPLMMVSRLAREHGVKGLLSGEGSDECFLGYPWLGTQWLVDQYYQLGRKLRAFVHGIPRIGTLLWPYDGETHHIVRALLNRDEILDDERLARTVAASLAPIKVSYHNMCTVDYLNYHLRTLLHRNDTMGMAGSIEARFPFLDHDVVKTAVNMSSKYKLRASPTVFEKAHPFIRDKWIVRKVADRYIPRGLSQRIKIGFWTTVFERMRVSPRYFDDSFTRNLFELTKPQMDDVLAKGDQDLAMRLLHLDVWGRVCVKEQSRDDCVEKLRDHITISPK